MREGDREGETLSSARSTSTVIDGRLHHTSQVELEKPNTDVGGQDHSPVDTTGVFRHWPGNAALHIRAL